MRVSSFAPPTTCSVAAGPRRSPSAPGASCWQPARPYAGARRDARRADAPGGADRAPRRRRAHEPRDRRAAVHQPAHRRVPPAQGVHEARRQLATGSSGALASSAPSSTGTPRGAPPVLSRPAPGCRRGRRRRLAPGSVGDQPGSTDRKDSGSASMMPDQHLADDPPADRAQPVAVVQRPRPP